MSSPPLGTGSRFSDRRKGKKRKGAMPGTSKKRRRVPNSHERKKRSPTDHKEGTYSIFVKKKNGTRRHLRKGTDTTTSRKSGQYLLEEGRTQHRKHITKEKKRYGQSKGKGGRVSKHFRKESSVPSKEEEKEKNPSVLHAKERGENPGNLNQGRNRHLTAGKRGRVDLGSSEREKKKMDLFFPHSTKRKGGCI